MALMQAHRRLVTLACLLAVPMVIQPTLLGEEASPPPYALINARIVPVTGPVIESGTLVMRDGRIAAVGSEVAPPADAIVMDAEGWTLYPGFIDAHSSVGMPTPSRDSSGPDVRRLAAERRERGDPTPGLDPHVTAVSLYAPQEEALQAARRMGITAAAVVPTAGILEGQSAVVALKDGAARSAIIRDRWAQHVAFEPFSRQRNDYPGTLMGVLATIRQHFSDADWYGEAWRRFSADPSSIPRPDHDDRLEALAASQARDQPVVFTAWSDNAILRTLGLVGELEVQGIVSGAIDGWRVADALKASGLPVLVSLDHRPRRDPSGFGAAPPGGLMAHPGAADREDAESNAARLHEAGVPFAFTSHGLEKTSNFLPNLRAVVRAGLPEDVALEALTRTPAEWLGVDAILGSLEVGKAAHVVAVEGDLFDDDGKVAAVWVDGQRYDVESSTSRQDSGGRQASAEDDEADDESNEPGDRVDRRVLTERRAPVGPLRPEVPVTAVRHATILTVTNGTIESGTIVIRDGRISSLGPDDEIEVPAGAREIDATGLHVMPGIVDAHIHIAMAGGGNEATQPVTPEVRIADVIDHRSPSIFRALTLGVTTVNVLHGSANVIGGQNAVLKMRWGRPAADLFVEGAQPGVKFALGENPKQTNRPRLPGVPRRYPATRMGVEHELRTSFASAREYQAAWKAHEAAMAAGTDPMPPRHDLRLEALVGILEGRILVHAHCYRSDEILMLLRVAEDFGFTIASLQHVLEGYKVADEIAAHGAGASTFADGWGYKMEAFDAIPYNMAIMAERGVTVSINSDAVGELGTRLFTQAAKAMKYGGVSEESALRMITINPASHLKLEERIGSIEVGKDADLAIFTAHPFSADARVRYTLVDGQVYFDSDDVELTDDVLESPRTKTDAGSNGENAGTNGDTQTAPDVTRSNGERFVAWQSPTQPSGDGRLTPASSYGDRTEPMIAGSDVVAIVGGRVVTMAGETIESGTVVIRDGRIAAVGAEVEVPAGARVIEAAGMVVTPGVINAGTSLGLSEIGAVSATQDANELADINAAVKAAVAIHPHSEMLAVTRVNGVTTAVAAPGGGMIHGQSALIDLAGWTPPEVVARSPLAMHMEFPELLDQPEDDEDDEAQARIETQRETLRQWMRRAQAYAGALATGTASASDDADELQALVPVVRGSLPVVVEVRSEEGIQAALAFASEFSLRLILASADDAWKVVDEIAAAGVPVILGPLPGRAPQHDPYDAVVVAASLLQEAGVRFAFRTGGATNARNLPYHAGLAVAHGLSREAAWYALTIGAAEIFGVDDQYGSLEVGKIANIVVADGDLLDVPTQIAHVLIRGQEIELISRHTRLWETFRARPVETR